MLQFIPDIKLKENSVSNSPRKSAASTRFTHVQREKCPDLLLTLAVQNPPPKKRPIFIVNQRPHSAANDKYRAVDEQSRIAALNVKPSEQSALVQKYPAYFCCYKYTYKSRLIENCNPITQSMFISKKNIIVIVCTNVYIVLVKILLADCSLFIETYSI